MRRWLLIWSLLLCACNEAEPVTQIMISVATDYEVPEELSEVTFVIEKQGGPVEDRRRFEHREVVTSKRAFPLTLAMTSINKGKPVVRVTVTGELSEGGIVRREAVVSFRAGQILSLPMNLLQVCRNRLCEEGQTTCGEGGRCEPIARDDLPPWTGDASPVEPGEPLADGSMPDNRTDGSTEMNDGGPGPLEDANVPMDSATPDGGTDGGTPVEPNIIALGVGSHHSCAVMRSGRVYCWGSNTRLALGSVTTELECPNQICTTPRRVPDVENAIQVVAGERSACALTSLGEVFCWGPNYAGQVGAAVADDPMPPTRVRFRATPQGASPLLTGVDQLASGRSHVCARVASSKALICWGGGPNEFRQIPAEMSDINVAVPTLITSGVERFAIGHYHGCFISEAGALSCWGWNSDAQAGLTPATEPPDYLLNPQTIFASGATDVSGGEAHTCAIIAGAVNCFGLAGAGQLGFGPVPVLPTCRYGICTPPLYPAESPGASPAVALALGDRLSCARHQDGQVSCWGSNEQGRAGQGAAAILVSPTFVPGLSGIRVLAAGFNHVCAASTDQVLCWGANNEGQLGPNATISTSSAQPLVVPIVEEL